MRRSRRGSAELYFRRTKVAVVRLGVDVALEVCVRSYFSDSHLQLTSAQMFDANSFVKWAALFWR